MGFISALKNLHHSLIPTENRADGGTWTTNVPLLAAAKQLEQTDCAAGSGAAITTSWMGFGGMVELLAATANTTECWIEAIEASNFLTEAPAAGAGTVDIAITMEAGTAVPTAAQVQAYVPFYLSCATGGPFAKYVPLDPPIFIPRGQRIACAMNSSLASKRTVATPGVLTHPKCCVRLQLSRAKIQA